MLGHGMLRPVSSRRQNCDRLRAFRGQHPQHLPPHWIAQRPQQRHHVHRRFRRCGRGCDLCSIWHKHHSNKHLSPNQCPVHSHDWSRCAAMHSKSGKELTLCARDPFQLVHITTLCALITFRLGNITTLCALITFHPRHITTRSEQRTRRCVPATNRRRRETFLRRQRSAHRPSALSLPCLPSKE